MNEKDIIDTVPSKSKFDYKDILWPNSKDKTKSDILKNKCITISNPIKENNQISENFKGKINLVTYGGICDFELNGKAGEIENICLSNAIKIRNKENNTAVVTLDNGKCFLCGRCEEVYPNLFKMGNNQNTAARNKEQLIDLVELQLLQTDKKHLNETINEKSSNGLSYEQIGKELKEKINSLFGRSLAIRQVDGGSCNGCEIEITALNNPIYDIERFGVQFVSSPRHADVLLVTGPVSQNMAIALEKTYQATPEPKIVIAVGACACSGGIFGNTYATTGGVDTLLPVEVYIPGCPPRPEALIYGILTAMNKIQV
ncbi:NADH-quinone oxidoreductase subunit NuoB [Candidatus Nitrosocosmicus franklandus]|uniref:Formate hydrogenlyase subunit 7 n=1 Tax=Candidatus Nitrosocosmicus franklandianus TaxID=1798806 RepID=A0A484I817_9ARCH|nr:NADH-quinone oxidoreductase subunit NuoB [Candidatus Nitrosocosmicus franklandus]VFJ13899.1 Formate hydrogenlyase subunit 7 [Candidatus Nitrosocosmicus franklandus]